MGNSFFENINTQAFVLNLKRLGNDDFGYKTFQTLIAAQPTSFVEMACWMLKLVDQTVETKCGSDKNWSQVGQSTVDGLLNQILDSMDVLKIEEVFLIHNHPGKTYAASKFPNVDLRFFGTSALDYASLKRYEYTLADKGVTAPVTGVVVPGEQPYANKYIYTYRGLNTTDPNYLNYVSQAMANGALLGGNSF